MQNRASPRTLCSLLSRVPRVWCLSVVSVSCLCSVCPAQASCFFFFSMASKSLHRRAAGRVLLRIYQRRSGRHTNLARYRTVALFLRYFRSIPQVGRRRCCGGDVQRVASSSSVSSAASSSCRRVTLRIYHRRSRRHMQADKTHDICIYSFSYLRSVP